MAAPPPNPTITSNLLSTHRALLDTLSAFLTVCTHHILFLRRIYPPISFVSTRAYNFPVRQNRHPDVCAWINDAVAAVRDQLDRNTVEKVAVCIFECDTNQVLERWTFDLHAIPVVPKRDRDIPFAASEESESSNKVNLVDLEATFRATLARISTSSAKLRGLPDGPGAPECSFTMVIEVKDQSDRPVGRLTARERQWIVAEPAAQDDRRPGKETTEDRQTSAKPSSKTHAVRRLEAGEIRMEVWVEEAAAKFQYPTSQPTAEHRAAAMSYGAGSEKFDPERGYELEKRDINRNAGNGIGTDYQRS